MPKTVNQETLAASLCVTARTVRNLEGRHVFEREPDGGYDELKCLRAYVAHISHDTDGRRARAEDALAQTQHRRLRMRKELGQLIAADELQGLAGEVWAAVLQIWNLAASHLYHGTAGVLPERDRLRIVGSIDELAKAELHVLRTKLEQRFAGVAVELTDETRVEALMAQLAGADDD